MRMASQCSSALLTINPPPTTHTHTSQRSVQTNQDLQCVVIIKHKHHKYEQLYSKEKCVFRVANSHFSQINQHFYIMKGHAILIRSNSASFHRVDESKACWETERGELQVLLSRCKLGVLSWGCESSQEEARPATPAKAANYIFHLDKNGGFLPMLLIIMSGI